MAGSLWIVHGGQTGVDRGAHDAAIDGGLLVHGYMPKNGCDELGLIPNSVARHLSRCTIPGFAPRTEVNVDFAHALLVVVADKHDPYATPGTKSTLDHWRRKRRRCMAPWQVVDPTDSRERIAEWVHAMLGGAWHGQEFRLMVAGPRASRWSNGHAEAAAFVRAIAVRQTESRQ